MDYNSNRKKLIMPEYGRNLQKMVDTVVAIKDRDQRNRSAQQVLDIMGNMYPYLRDVADFKHKLWDHILIMSDFRLDIDSPYPAPTKELLYKKPKPMKYPQNKRVRRHYGKTIEKMIDKACTFKAGPEKDALIQLIANHMKKSYLAWNRDSVSDEHIIKDMLDMSNGQLKVDKDMRLSDSQGNNRGRFKPKSSNDNRRKFQGPRNNSQNNNTNRKSFDKQKNTRK